MRKPDLEVFRRGGGPAGAPGVRVRGARAAGAVVILHRDPGMTVTETEILFDLPT